jgi:DNA uptake protein ComE-like DNA-binding protein
MWKDFFYFSRGERFAILALIALIAFVQVLLWTSDYWLPLLPMRADREQLAQKTLTNFRDTLSGGSSNRRSSLTYSAGSRKTEVRLMAFNPNTADSITFVRLGLRPYVAKNILKYRRKGGSFHKPEDFSRIYGVSSEQYVQLAPYIRLSENQTAAALSMKSSLSKAPTSIVSTEPSAVEKIGNQMDTFYDSSVERSQAYTSLHAFDLNTADTAFFQQLKGIGPITANRITRYRNQLGGFYSLRQLEEIKGLYPETLGRLQALLRVDPAKIIRLNVNKASLEKLRAHPYLSFYQAKAIVELRKARGFIHSIDELAEFKEFTPIDLEKLKWYLCF